MKSAKAMTAFINHPDHLKTLCDTIAYEIKDDMSKKRGECYKEDCGTVLEKSNEFPHKIKITFTVELGE